MNHFIYAMTSTDPAPATGGDTKSWFYHYKWDVDDFAYVPVPEDSIELEVPQSTFILWFVMDEAILGCVPVHAFMPDLSGRLELHYDTRLIQVKADDGEVFTTSEKTGKVVDRALYEALKTKFDEKYPPRNPELAAQLGLGQSNG